MVSLSIRNGKERRRSKGENERGMTSNFDHGTAATAATTTGIMHEIAASDQSWFCPSSRFGCCYCCCCRCGMGASRRRRRPLGGSPPSSSTSPPCCPPASSLPKKPDGRTGQNGASRRGGGKEEDGFEESRGSIGQRGLIALDRQWSTGGGRGAMDDDGVGARNWRTLEQDIRIIKRRFMAQSPGRKFVGALALTNSASGSN